MDAAEPPDRALDRVTDGFVALDRDWRMTYVNRPAGKLLGEEPEALVGRRLWDAYPMLAGTRFEAEFRRSMDTQEPVSFEEYYGPADRWVAVRAYPSDTGLSLYARDVTARHERQHELRRYETLVETSPDPMFALDDEFRISLVNRAMEELTGLSREEVVGEPASDALATGVVTEEEFDHGMAALRRLLADDGTDYLKHVAPMRTPDGDRIDAEYHLGVVAREDGTDSVVGVVRDVTEHREVQRQISRQRDQLETLDRINALVQETIEGVVEAPTREEVEAMVCEHLVDSDLYTCAWTAERATGDDAMAIRATAGVDAADLTEVLDRYDGLDRSDPSMVALDDGEIYVTDDVFDDPDIPEEVVADVPEDEVRASIVVPLQYDDAVYGVLGVAADRPDAFGDREVAAFEALGETVGFAIDATGNRRLLLGDAAAEVAFEVADPAEPFVRLSATRECRCELERLVPAGDGDVVHYVSVDGVDGPDAVEPLSAVDGVTGVRLLRDGADDAFLAVTASGTAPARLAAAGATPGTFVASGGVARATAEVPPGADVHSVVEALRGTFEDSRVTAKRFVDRPPGSVREFGRTVADRLTERQRDALGAALSAGYYEWPRESTAEEVADSMGISSATLHYHLRRAEAELVGALLDVDG